MRRRKGSAASALPKTVIRFFSFFILSLLSFEKESSKESFPPKKRKMLYLLFYEFLVPLFSKSGGTKLQLIFTIPNCAIKSCEARKTRKL
jgi:hypothetical protein